MMHTIDVFGRKKQRVRADSVSESGYVGLRQLALRAFDSSAVIGAPDHPRVAGVVVDIPSSAGIATVVAMADDTTSLYTSTGGGTIGAGAHAPVAVATHRLLAAIDAQLDQFPAGRNDHVPANNFVRFHVWGVAGPAVADVPQDCFWGRARHVLTPVIAATQDVITAISSVDQASPP
jgi:hypothetical protein